MKKSVEMGLTARKTRFLGLFFDFSRLQISRPRKIEEKSEFQQSVPGYDPQVVAMHTPPLAATLSSTARGSCLNPDVGHKEKYNDRH